MVCMSICYHSTFAFHSWFMLRSYSPNMSHWSVSYCKHNPHNNSTAAFIFAKAVCHDLSWVSFVSKQKIYRRGSMVWGEMSNQYTQVWNSWQNEAWLWLFESNMIIEVWSKPQVNESFAKHISFIKLHFVTMTSILMWLPHYCLIIPSNQECTPWRVNVVWS